MTATEHQILDHGWEFRRLDEEADSASWSPVGLPHSPFVADLNGRNHWLGLCQYRRLLKVERPVSGFRYILYVGAAMHSVEVDVDGQVFGAHEGGYLPFEVDLTKVLCDGKNHELTLELDNRGHADVPPGRVFADLDFCWYGGLYRNVELRVCPPIRITEPVSADEPAGGGVFVRTLAVSDDVATVVVKTQVENAGSANATCAVHVEWLDEENVVLETRTAGTGLEAGGRRNFSTELSLLNPRLWSVDTPNLYRMRVTVLSESGDVLDRRIERFGVRWIEFSRSGGFRINGKRRRLRGTNRHQEFPYVGYAAPAAAQFRDALRIKEAGFDYVRLSHYPQSPSFLDACDELGIVVMNCIPGWQFIGGERFREACFRNARELIRRDRNHPSVVLWELSLNETPMDDAFMDELHVIGHEEFPGPQLFTCGWIDRYDVFIHSRQHGELHRWRNGDRAMVVAEYGDWEFYAANEGFDQKTGAGLLADWANSRKFRKDGERGLRQQAWNHQLALNDTLSSDAVFDGQWAMFDYARGYHPVRAAVGVMDIFRLPKFSYYFYRSQRDPDEGGANWMGGPVVFIASHWTAESDLEIVVFSNCEEVELRLNGEVCGRSGKNPAWCSQFLPHPPFVFSLPKFEPGTLAATGFVDGEPVTSHSVSTPGSLVSVDVELDDLGIRAAPGSTDLVTAHARCRDSLGVVCVGRAEPIRFTVLGPVQVVGPTSAVCEAGIGSVVIRIEPDTSYFEITAAVGDVRSDVFRWERRLPEQESIEV